MTTTNRMSSNTQRELLSCSDAALGEADARTPGREARFSPLRIPHRVKRVSSSRNSSRMSNFKRLAERFAQGEKLLTTQEKIMIMARHLKEGENSSAMLAQSHFPRIQLVVRLGKKPVSH